MKIVPDLGPSKVWRRIPSDDPNSLFPASLIFHAQLPYHLKGVEICADTFRELVRDTAEVILEYEMTEEGAKDLQEALAGPVRQFEVWVDKNFLGEPYFRFSYEGVDLFIDVEPAPSKSMWYDVDFSQGLTWGNGVESSYSDGYTWSDGSSAHPKIKNIIGK